jgi:hypothetical protein
MPKTGTDLFIDLSPAARPAPATKLNSNAQAVFYLVDKTTVSG